MNACSPRRSRLARTARRLERPAGLALVLAVLGNAPVLALGAGSRPDAAGPPRTQALDPAAFLDALGRGEVNGESLVLIIGIAIVAGLLLTLLVATLRGRRRRSPDGPAAAARDASRAVVDTSRPGEARPVEDLAARRAVMFAGLDTLAEPPTATFPAVVRAPISGSWPGARPSGADDAEPDAGFGTWYEGPAPHEPGVTDDPRINEPFPPVEAETTRAMGLATPAAATASSGLVARPPEWRVSVPPPAEPAPAAAPAGMPSSLGTPQAPLVVQLLGERRGPGSGPNLSVVIAIATFAVGLAFAAGALVGAAIGTTLGATIGAAFAGGAGTAIVATAIFLRGQRR